MHAESLQFSLDEAQWQNDWAELLNLASQPGKRLLQDLRIILHVYLGKVFLICITY